MQNSYAYPTSFDMLIDGLEDVSFNVQKCNIAGMTMTTALGTTPGNAQINFSGDDMVFNPLQVSFLLDENFQNWFAVYKLMRGATPFVDSSDFRPFDQNPLDVKIMAYDSTEKLVLTINYVNCYITGLTDIQFDVTITNKKPIVCDIQMVFDYYTVN